MKPSMLELILVFVIAGIAAFISHEWTKQRSWPPPPPKPEVVTFEGSYLVVRGDRFDLKTIVKVEPYDDYVRESGDTYVLHFVDTDVTFQIKDINYDQYRSIFTRWLAIQRGEEYPEVSTEGDLEAALAKYLETAEGQ